MLGLLYIKKVFKSFANNIQHLRMESFFYSMLKLAQIRKIFIAIKTTARFL